MADKKTGSQTEVERVNREMNAPEDRRQDRHQAEADAALQPSGGAPIQQARIGAELAGEGGAMEKSETADALKRAAENDTRV